MARARSRLIAAAVLGAVAVTLAACGSASSGGTTASTSGSVTGDLTVFAASSLKESFTAIGAAFEAAHPGVKVTFSFGASSTLATQITEKAPADVFASASSKTMETVTTAGLATDPRVFAVNSLEIATPTSPTVPVSSLTDLAKPGLKVAVCAADVPCGVAADTLFAQNKLSVTPVTREVDVKSVLSKVTLGEVDAGIVYVTDVRAAGGSVVGVEIPKAENVTTDYPIAALTGSAHSAAAQAFVAFVLSAEGQKFLSAAGFGAP